MAGGETILIVEDDATLMRGLKDNFQHDGYRVLTAEDGEKALELVFAGNIDLVVLDIMLPKVNGYEICRLIRKEGLTMPVVMLTAKGQEQDIILGLNIGADDYVTKPFSIKQLLARAAALLRRSHQEQGRSFSFGPFLLETTSHRLVRDGKEIPLTPKEFRLLQYLISQSGRALTRSEILRHVWGLDVFVTERSVDRCITTLRAKIEDNPAQPEYIQMVREVGYRFALKFQADEYT